MKTRIFLLTLWNLARDLKRELISVNTKFFASLKNIESSQYFFLYQRIAEEYEAELEKTLSDVEERLKPPVMRFVEKLNLPPGVDELLAHDVVTEVEDPSAIVAIMKEKANTGDLMTRVQLMSFMRTILNLRNCFNDEGIGSGVDVMQVRLSV